MAYSVMQARRSDRIAKKVDQKSIKSYARLWPNPSRFPEFYQRSDRLQDCVSSIASKSLTEEKSQSAAKKPMFGCLGADMESEECDTVLPDYIKRLPEREILFLHTYCYVLNNPTAMPREIEEVCWAAFRPGGSDKRMPPVLKDADADIDKLTPREINTILCMGKELRKRIQRKCDTNLITLLYKSNILKSAIADQSSDNGYDYLRSEFRFTNSESSWQLPQDEKNFFLNPRPYQILGFLLSKPPPCLPSLHTEYWDKFLKNYILPTMNEASYCFVVACMSVAFRQMKLSKPLESTTFWYRRQEYESFKARWTALPTNLKQVIVDKRLYPMAVRCSSPECSLFWSITEEVPHIFRE